MKKINLGCGLDYRQGWVNVDYDKSVKADEYFDLRKAFPVEDSKYSHLLAQDVLEHFTKQDAPEFLAECARVLKAGGSIEVRVPNVYAIYDSFSHDPEVMMKFIYGNTSMGELGAHRYGYTKKSLRKALSMAGFSNIEISQETTNFIATAKKTNHKKPKLNLMVSGQDSGGIGGAENFLVWLASEISKKHTVNILAVKGSSFSKLAKKNRLKQINPPFRMDVLGGSRGLVKFLLTLPFSYSYYLKVLIDQKRRGLSVVVLTGISDKSIISPIAKLLKIRVIWVEFGPLEKALSLNYYVPFFFYQMAKVFADVVIVPTNNTKRSLIDFTKISESKLQVIPCAIPKIKISNSKKYYKNSFVVGQLSRLQRGKGQDTLIEATVMLKKKIKNLKIVFIGEGGDKQWLLDLADKHGVGHIVEFLGFRKDAYNLVSKFDIFTFMSRWELEGFGIAPLEAMKLGVPVIASDRGPVPEVLGNAAVIIPPYPKALAEEIYKLYKSEKDRTDLIIKSNKHVARYEISTVTDSYLKAISETFY